MKKILVLGTGNAQEDLIRHCNDMGFRTYACSYIRKDKAEKYADRFELIDITDVDKIKEYVTNHKIDYIYSVGSDIAMPSAARVAEELQLPFPIPLQVAYVCNNKDILRGCLGNDFEGNLKHLVLSKMPEEIPLEFPVIMKPVDSQGQRGVIRIDNMEEMMKNFDRSISFSHLKQVIVEEYVDGEELSVNVFVCHGKIEFLLISDREVWEGFPGGLIKKHILPSRWDGTNAENKIKDLVERVIKKLDIKDGPVYFQIKMKNGRDPKLLEVTPRLDGCHMWRLIREYTGVDLLEASIRILMGEEVDVKYVTTLLSEATLEFMCAPPKSKFQKSTYDISDARYVKFYYEENETVKKLNGYMEKCGYIIRGTSK